MLPMPSKLLTADLSFFCFFMEFRRQASAWIWNPWIYAYGLGFEVYTMLHTNTNANTNTKTNI